MSLIPLEDVFEQPTNLPEVAQRSGIVFHSIQRAAMAAPISRDVAERKDESRAR
jgi:hypothetical protein